MNRFYRLFSHLSTTNLLLYKAHLIEHYKPQTVNLRIRAINSCADYEYLKRRLWEDEAYGYYYLVRLTAAAGVRVSELVTFQIEDIRQGFKDVYSKGNKMRRTMCLPWRLRESTRS